MSRKLHTAPFNFLTVADLADRLGVSVKTARRWIRRAGADGSISTIWFGNRHCMAVAPSTVNRFRHYTGDKAVAAVPSPARRISEPDAGEAVELDPPRCPTGLLMKKAIADGRITSYAAQYLLSTYRCGMGGYEPPATSPRDERGYTYEDYCGMARSAAAELDVEVGAYAAA
jgi:hypothetical protein